MRTSLQHGRDRRFNANITNWTVRSSDDDVEYVTLAMSGRCHVLNNIVAIKDGLPLDSVRIISDIQV